MPTAVRYLAVLVVPLLLSRLVEAFLGSRWGEPVLRNTMGEPAVATGRGREVFSRYTKIVSALLLVAINRWQDQAAGEPIAERLGRVGGLGWLQYTSEVLLGLGALFKTMAEFFEDAREVRTGRSLSAQGR